MRRSWSLYIVWVPVALAPFIASAAGPLLNRAPERLLLVVLALPLFVALPLSIWIQERIIERCLREELVNQCTTCGYDLTGNLSGVCPECGTAITPNRSDPADDLR